MKVRLELLRNGIASIVFCAPDLNIFDVAMRDEFIEALQAVRDHPDARILLLRAEGKHFSAGADLREFGKAETPFEARRIRWDRDPWGLLWDLPQPSVIALHGHVVGAGLEMALLCDLRLTDPSGRFGLPETRLGMLPAAGGTQSMPTMIGASVSLPLILTAKTLSPEEAVDRGIVHEIVADVDAHAMRLATTLAGLDRRVTAALRRAIHAVNDFPLAEGLAIEKTLARLL
jgi:enoyl-CoA hydratase/carnithine racemase